jgi:signal transduction histidine kinase
MIRSRLRLRLRTKLLCAFVMVLLPVLALLWVNFRVSLSQQEESTLRDQLLTAEAIAVQVDEAFDALMGFGWAVAHDPLAHTRDRSQLHAHLLELAEATELPALIAVYDEHGVNRGWAAPGSDDERGRDLGDSPDFERVMATNLPHVSDVLVLERLGVLGVMVVVPIRNADGRAAGMVMLGLSTDQLVKRYEHARLSPGQAILLSDRTGRLAFHTTRRDLSYGESGRFVGILPPLEALSGIPTIRASFFSPILADQRLAAFVSTQKYRWVVGVTEPRALALAPIERAFHTQIAAFIGILAVTMLIVALLARYLLRPIRRLEAAAAAFGRGDLARRVTVDSGDEIGRLGAAFNAMAERLSRLYEEQRDLLRMREEFMQAAAHELKTPITTIRSSIYLLLDSAPDRQTQPVLDIIRRQAMRMTLLVEDLLTVTSLRREAAELRRGRLDLGALTREAAQRAAEAATEKTIALCAVEPLWVEADRELIDHMIIRLLENALETSPEKATIEVSAQRQGNDAVVAVVDHGSGIPVERQAHLFEPFYELVPPGMPGYAGVVSLRLAVCKRIVEAHGGRIWLTSTPCGSTFSFALPLTECDAVTADQMPSC